MDSGKMGLTTLGMALALKSLYAATDFDPPNPVFWFFMGFNANLALGLLDRLTGSDISPRALAGFGEETVASVDAAIAQYEANIAGLKKIIASGSPQGKKAAKAKLRTANAGLATFRRKRAALVG